jgi:hypothetical protein
MQIANQHDSNEHEPLLPSRSRSRSPRPSSGTVGGGDAGSLSGSRGGARKPGTSGGASCGCIGRGAGAGPSLLSSATQRRCTARWSRRGLAWPPPSPRLGPGPDPAARARRRHAAPTAGVAIIAARQEAGCGGSREGSEEAAGLVPSLLVSPWGGNAVRAVRCRLGRASRGGRGMGGEKGVLVGSTSTQPPTAKNGSGGGGGGG